MYDQAKKGSLELIRIYTLDNGKKTAVVRPMASGLSGPVNSFCLREQADQILAFSGNLVDTRTRKRVVGTLWSASSGRFVSAVDISPPPTLYRYGKTNIQSILSPDGRLVALTGPTLGEGRGRYLPVLLYNLGAKSMTLRSATGNVTERTRYRRLWFLTPGNKFIATSPGGFQDVNYGHTVWYFSLCSLGLISGDGRTMALAGSSDNTVRTWDISSMGLGIP
jgi:WD40 repeat protein